MLAHVDASATTKMQDAIAPVGTRDVAAFFDMDNTILRGSSGRLYLKYLRQKGHLSWRRWLIITWRVGLYVVGVTDFPHLMARLMTQVAGSEEAEAWRISHAWFREMLRDYIADAARESIARHLSQGHHVVIVSASTPYAVAPVARDLGLDSAYLATRLEVADGRFTGRVLLPACYGPGKLTLTRQYANEHGLDLSRSYFYTDSHHDLSLLEAVGQPVAVNPGRKLAKIAARRGWPVVRFY